MDYGARADAARDEAVVRFAVEQTIGAGTAQAIVGIGVDLVELSRMAIVLQRTPSFGARVFTESEHAYCVARRDPAERFAARFAAKEAVLKALGLGLWSVPLNAIEVTRDADSGQPSILLHAAAADAANRRAISSWRLSITHTERVAVAVAVAISFSGSPSSSAGVMPDPPGVAGGSPGFG